MKNKDSGFDLICSKHKVNFDCFNLCYLVNMNMKFIHKTLEFFFEK